jgi:hypothetical protein
MTAIEFKREPLYEEVWQTPITQLAKKYGLSDNGLRKICVALNVPLPPRGFWAKRAASKSVRRPALPPASDRQSFVSQPPPAGPNFRTSDDNVWLQGRLEFDTASENEPAYDPSPTRWHPVIAAHRSNLRKAAKDLETARRANERWEKLPPHRRGLGLDDGWKWRMVADRGQALVDSHKPLPFRVSAGCYERALAISNALTFAAKPRGFKVGDDDKGQRLVFIGHDAVVPWRINERLEQRVRTRTTYDGKKEPEKYVVPTGELKITLEARYGSTIAFVDDRGLPLEKQITRIFAGLYKCVIRQRVKSREDAAREKRWAEEACERARIESEMQRAANRLEEERSKRERLIADSRRWHDAQALRSYIAQTQERQPTGAQESAAFEDWVKWASSVADDLDPCVETRVSEESGIDSAVDD